MLVSKVHESAVISAPISSVWRHVRPMKFEWWSLVDHVVCTNGAPGQVGSMHDMVYKDGANWTVR
jgi:hypothetical protein